MKRGLLAIIPLAALVTVAAVAESPGEDPVEQDCVTAFEDGIRGHPSGLAAGRDGRMWFTEPMEDRIGVLDPDSGRAREFDLPEGSAPRTPVFADERLWFTSANDRVGVFDRSTRRARFFSDGIPPGSVPHTPVAPGDGFVYWTHQNEPALGRIPERGGRIEMIRANLPQDHGLHGLVAAPGGDALWAARQDADEIVRFDLRRQRFDRTVRFSRESGPHDVGVGPGGDIFATLQHNAKIGERDAETERTSEHETGLMPSNSPDQQPDLKLVDLAVDESSGAVWASSFLANRIYKLDLGSGELSEPVCDLPASGSSLEIVLDPDDTVWFADPIGGRIVRVDREAED